MFITIHSVAQKLQLPTKKNSKTDIKEKTSQSVKKLYFMFCCSLAFLAPNVRRSELESQLAQESVVDCTQDGRKESEQCPRNKSKQVLEGWFYS